MRVEFLSKLAAEHKTDIGEVEKEFLRTMRPSSIIRRSPSQTRLQILSCSCAGKALAITGAALRADGGVVRSIA